LSPAGPPIRGLSRGRRDTEKVSHNPLTHLLVPACPWIAKAHPDRMSAWVDCGTGRLRHGSGVTGQVVRFVRVARRFGKRLAHLLPGGSQSVGATGGSDGTSHANGADPWDPAQGPLGQDQVAVDRALERRWADALEGVRDQQRGEPLPVVVRRHAASARAVRPRERRAGVLASQGGSAAGARVVPAVDR
jgi:hypothetical protein